MDVISLKVGESNRAVMISAAEEPHSVVIILTDVYLQTMLLNKKLALMENLPDKQYPLCAHVTVMPNPTKTEGDMESQKKSINPPCVTGAVKKNGTDKVFAEGRKDTFIM